MPHALWGTICLLQSYDRALHPLLANLHKNTSSISLCPNIYFVDSDMQKQQETGILTFSLLPHKLSGLHMISVIGLLAYCVKKVILSVTSFSDVLMSDKNQLHTPRSTSSWEF